MADTETYNITSLQNFTGLTRAKFTGDKTVAALKAAGASVDGSPASWVVTKEQLIKTGIIDPDGNPYPVKRRGTNKNSAVNTRRVSVETLTYDEVALELTKAMRRRDSAAEKVAPLEDGYAAAKTLVTDYEKHSEVLKEATKDVTDYGKRIVKLRDKAVAEKKIAREKLRAELAKVQAEIDSIETA